VKKRKSGGGANWMDTYGDMVTLLLCFFVLLYSMSTISQEKFKALVMSFNPDSLKTITASPGGDGPNADSDEGEGAPLVDSSLSQAEVDQQMQDLYEALQAYVEDNNMQDSISVTEEGGKVFVSFNQTAFFDGEKYELREESLPILEAVSGMLSDAAKAIDEVRILGHTAQASADKTNHVRVDRFLASNRATNVLVYIQEHSTVDPARLVSEGLGQWRPVASNATPEGRAQNRRVEMIVSGRNLETELESALQQYSTQPAS
jgi:chemotaxis protein MotB